MWHQWALFRSIKMLKFRGLYKLNCMWPKVLGLEIVLTLVIKAKVLYICCKYQYWSNAQVCFTCVVSSEAYYVPVFYRKCLGFSMFL